MRKSILAPLALALFACAAASAQKTFTVSTMDQFLKAIGPDRTIVMKPGTYEVKKSASANGRYFRWDDSGDGGSQLTLVDLPRLTIKAQSPGVRIIATSPYVWVLSFENCGEIVLEGLTMGHETSEPCMAGVLQLNVAEEVVLDSCELYGSGSMGISAYGVSRISLANTAIRDCTSHAGYFVNGTEIALDGCTIRGNGAYPLFALDGVDTVTFRNTEISGNSGQGLLNPTGRLETKVEFIECVFEGNEIEFFCSPGTDVVFEESRFSANAFGDDPAAIAGLTKEDAEAGATEVHVFEPAGLSLAVPSSWQAAVADDGKALQIRDTQRNSMTLVQLNEIYEVPSGSDMADAEALLQDAFQSFRNSLEKGNPAAAMDMIGDVLDIGGHPAADFAGLSDHTGAGGLYYWARLIIANGKVWMIFSLTDRKDHPVLKALMESVVLTPGGG